MKLLRVRDPIEIRAVFVSHLTVHMIHEIHELQFGKFATGASEWDKPNMTDTDAGSGDCISTQCEIDTGLYADAVEWCPIPSLQDYLMCGTYQLEENQATTCFSDQDEGGTEGEKNKASRKGQLQLYQLKVSNGSPNAESNATIHGSLREVQKIDLPGILDIKWCQHAINEIPYLASVDASGDLQVFCLDNETGGRGLAQVSKTNLGPDCLGLSLDWSTAVYASNQPSIICSDSKGRLSLCVPQEGSLTFTVEQQWLAHGYEAWISAFNYWTPSIVYSGGDDCKFKGWDTRTDCQMPVFTSKRHTMGICSIHSNPFKEFCLVSGSYDETVLLWDTRNMKRPISELSIGGGVWRLKWDPWEGSRLLAAGMYNGFHIIDCKEAITGSGEMSHVASYTKNSTLAYGADWCRTTLHEQWSDSPQHEYNASVADKGSPVTPECCLDLPVNTSDASTDASVGTHHQAKSSSTKDEGTPYLDVHQIKEHSNCAISKTDFTDTDSSDLEQIVSKTMVIFLEQGTKNDEKGKSNSDSSCVEGSKVVRRSERLIATCSFYNHMLHLWTWKPDS